MHSDVRSPGEKASLFPEAVCRKSERLLGRERRGGKADAAVGLPTDDSTAVRRPAAVLKHPLARPRGPPHAAVGLLIRNGVLIASLAQGLIGGSLLWDKILLRKPQTTNLINYVFWLGGMSIFGLAVIPFGFSWPKPTVATLAFATGILDLAATYLYYAVLQHSEASASVAVMGGFSTAWTVIFAALLLPVFVGKGQVSGLVALVAAGFLMFFSEHAHVNLPRLVPKVVLAAAIFGLENVLQRIVFQRASFVSGFVFISLGTFSTALLLLGRSGWRRQIFTATEKARESSRIAYFLNRFMNGLGSFLIFYAISLTHPAIVDALAGVRYTVVFVGAFALSRLCPSVLNEDFHGWTLAGKLSGTGLVATGLALLAIHAS